MSKLDIRHGELIDVVGMPAKSQALTIVPAMVQLSGTMFGSGHYFADHPKFPAAIIPQGLDAPFVRARIPIAFGYTPTIDSELEKSLLCEGFVAVLSDNVTGIPFYCTDHYGRTGLTFSADGPDNLLQEQIADAFWTIIASEPGLVEDFEYAVFHPGACIWIHYGCRNGELFVYEDDEA